VDATISSTVEMVQNAFNRLIILFVVLFSFQTSTLMTIAHRPISMTLLMADRTQRVHERRTILDWIDGCCVDETTTTGEWIDVHWTHWEAPQIGLNDVWWTRERMNRCDEIRVDDHVPGDQKTWFENATAENENGIAMSDVEILWMVLRMVSMEVVSIGDEWRRAIVIHENDPSWMRSRCHSCRHHHGHQGLHGCLDYSRRQTLSWWDRHPHHHHRRLCHHHRLSNRRDDVGGGGHGDLIGGHVDCRIEQRMDAMPRVAWEVSRHRRDPNQSILPQFERSSELGLSSTPLKVLDHEAVAVRIGVAVAVGVGVAVEQHLHLRQ
jgi:hypothetical protein